MNDQGEWPLQKIRQAYREVLTAYSEIFPLHPRERKDREDVFPEMVSDDRRANRPDKKDRPNMATKIIGQVPKEASNQLASGQVWYRGESLDGLNQDMRVRVTRALDFGI